MEKTSSQKVSVIRNQRAFLVDYYARRVKRNEGKSEVVILPVLIYWSVMIAISSLSQSVPAMYGDPASCQ